MNRLAHAAVALGWLLAQPALAAEGTEAPNGAAVTVLTAAKSCFSDIVDVSGILVPKEEIAIRPDRLGLKVADVLVDAGETVTAGQILARLTTPDGGTLQIQSTTAGLVSASTAVIGAVASGKGEALFSIIARSEFDFIGGTDCQPAEAEDRPDGADPGDRRRRDGRPGPPSRLHRGAEQPARR